MTSIERSTPSRLQLAGRFLFVLIIWTTLLFVPAGTLRWPQAWAFVGSFAAYLLIYVRYTLRRDPGQLRERSGSSPRGMPWDRAILRAYSVLVVVLFVVAGLDAKRFHWAAVPVTAQVGAWAGLALAGTLIMWCARSNTYLSRVARIQSDRGQTVVGAGPYAYIRHPMYAGIILLFDCTGPALGSAWSLVPGLLIGALYVVRTALEDRMLREELEGYTEYSRRVRWRLLPGVW